MNIDKDHPDDAINVASELHDVLYEDDKMRVLKVHIKPGASAGMHWHPHSVNYVLAGGRVRIEVPDGASEDVSLVKGQVTSTTKEIMHAVKNIGATDVETIEIELKY